MSLAVAQEALSAAERSEDLAHKLGVRISSRFDVSKLQSCLVNRLARSLRSLNELISRTDRPFDQELDYLKFIQNAVSSCAHILANIHAYIATNTAEELAIVTVSNDESPLKRFERALVLQTNSLAMAQYLFARQLYVFWVLFDSHGRDS